MENHSIDALIGQLQSDFQQATLTAADGEMLGYSSKLTMTPQSIDATDIQRLRSVGFDDRAIHDIACCVAYFAFVNRVADGLGVELE